MNTNPREIFGIGTKIEVGQIADLTVFDLNEEYKINSNDFLSMGKATPFEGEKLCGRNLLTVKDGEIIKRLLVYAKPHIKSFVLVGFKEEE